MNPQLDIGSVPREVELTGEGRVLVGLSLGLAAGALAAGLGLGLLHVRQAADRDRIAREGVQITGHVVRVATTGREHRRRVVTYQYEANGVERFGNATLRERDRRPAMPGDPIAVGYLSSEPSRSWVVGIEPRVVPLFVAPLTAAGLLLGAWLIGLRLRRNRSLLREGRLAEGRVVATQKVSGQHQRGYRITYEFRTMSGAAVRGTTGTTGRKPPAVGEPLVVIYHREQPQWSAIYPLPLVRPATR